MDQRIQSTIQYTEVNLDQPIDVKALAARTCMSLSHFHRVFRDCTGTSPYKYFEKLKMQKAFEMICHGAFKVASLTNSLGYQDYETFSRSFKKHHAIAPDDLRAIANKIRNTLHIGPEQLLIKTFATPDDREIPLMLRKITKDLDQLLRGHGYTKGDLEEATVMSVVPKSMEVEGEAILVKQKYLIYENPEMHQTLLQLSKHDDN